MSKKLCGIRRSKSEKIAKKRQCSCELSAVRKVECNVEKIGKRRLAKGVSTQLGKQ